VNFCYINSPVGKLLLAGDAEGIKHINFPMEKKPVHPQPDWQELPAFFASAVVELEEYFAGERKQFAVAVKPQGTRFQLGVWQELGKIPYGRTVSYGELARRVGQPKASRAVGAANGANPIPIIIPCHRVIGADGSLTGFGGGLHVKQYLLELEKAI